MPPRSARLGFTLVEIMVSLVLCVIVIAATGGLMVSQWRQHTRFRETMDSQETLRSAAVLLSADLRPLSASQGDLTSIAAQSLVLRSALGTGVVCGRTAAASLRYGLSGIRGIAVGDSALIFHLSSGTWRRASVTQVWNNPTTTTPGPACATWAGSPAPAIVVQLATTSAGDTGSVGSPIRIFRSVRYSVTAAGGQSWLGRQVGTGGATDVMTGPLQATNGLTFGYFDAAGAVTAVPASVARIQVVLRARSAKNTHTAAGIGPVLDSTVIQATLRN